MAQVKNKCMLPRRRPTFALLSRLKRSASVTLQKRGRPQGQVSPGTERGWGGLDLLEWGDMRKPRAAWGKEKCVLGNWGIPKGDVRLGEGPLAQDWPLPSLLSLFWDSHRLGDSGTL